MTLRMILGLLAAAALAGAAWAQGVGVGIGLGPHDSSQPIEITSDELALDQTSGAAVFTGNVVAIQGDLKLTAAKVRVEYGEAPEGGNRIERVIAEGDVVMVQGDDAAEAQNAVYTVPDGRVVMTGEVLVVQGETVLSADKLTYDLDSGRGLMEGRVKTLLVPESN